MSTDKPANRYEQPLRDLFADADYDRFKSLEGDEEGEDKFPAMAEKFAAAVDASESVDFGGTLVPIEDIAKMIAGELEYEELAAGGFEWWTAPEAVVEGNRIAIDAEVDLPTPETRVTLVLRVESVTVQ